VRLNSRPAALFALLLLASVSVAACSTKAWYAGLRSAAENDCRRLPPGETGACLARLNAMPYEDYERKRSGQSP
jgi:hypothetical protein